MWFALILRVFSSRINNLTLPACLSSSSFILPVPRSFHSPASLSKRYNLHFLHAAALSSACLWLHVKAVLMTYLFHTSSRSCSAGQHGSALHRRKHYCTAYTSNRAVSASSPVLVSTSCNCTTGAYSAAHSSSLPASSSSSFCAVCAAGAEGFEVSTPVNPAKPLPVPNVEDDPNIGVLEEDSYTSAAV